MHSMTTLMLIEDAFDNTLSLDGSTPNEMAAPLNMGGNRVINVSNAINNTDAPNLQQVNAIISNASSGLIAQRREKQTASAAQTVVNLTGLSYFPNSNNLSVYVNGVKYYVGDAYTETSPTQVTFVEPLTEGDRLEFVTNEAVANQVGDAANVSYTPAGTGATQTNVESKLREFVSVKDFGAVGDGVTDDTAAVQAAYNYCASIGGGNILWPRATYKVNGTILFTSNTKTDLGGSTIIGNNQTLFETGYRSGSTVLTTVGTSDSNFTQAVFGATFGNGKIQSTSLAFRLVKFLWHCHIHEIEITTGKFIDGYICFYSGYSDLLYSGTTNFFGRFSPTANFTTGSSTIDVADSDATSLANGMVFASYSVPLGTTITNIGAAGSGGVGRERASRCPTTPSEPLRLAINTVGIVPPLTRWACSSLAATAQTLCLKSVLRLGSGWRLIWLALMVRRLRLATYRLVPMVLNLLAKTGASLSQAHTRNKSSSGCLIARLQTTHQ
jgi:hypothetical protein